MRRWPLQFCSSLIVALLLFCGRGAFASAGEPLGEMSAFTAANTLPGTLSITSSAIGRMDLRLLPSLATAHRMHLNLRFATARLPKTAEARVLEQRLPDAPSFSQLIDAIPVGERMRRIGRTHLNTSDASMKNDFALCYRIDRRWGLQMIPGDPTPVKAPVASFKDADGVTVGVVMRLAARQ